MSPATAKKLQEQADLIANYIASGLIVPNTLRARYRRKGKMHPNTHGHTCNNKGGVGVKHRRRARRARTAAKPRDGK